MKTFHRLFRFLLRAWPPRFRAQHGPQALRMASRRVREESGARRITRAAVDPLAIGAVAVCFGACGLAAIAWPAFAASAVDPAAALKDS